jgi:hypothetical protein
MTGLSRRHGLSGQARLAWLLAVVSVAILPVGVAVKPPPESDSGPVLLILATLVGLLGVGALLVTRAPGNAIGWWLILAGELVTVESLAQAATEFGVLAEPVPWTVIGLTVLVPQVLEPVAIAVVLIVVPLHFPDGRLLSPRWRWVLWLTVVAITAGAVVTLFGPGNDGPFGVGLIPNPLAVPGLGPLLDALKALSFVTIVSALVGAALSMVVRFRHSGRVERQQLKWLLAVAFVAVVAFTASSVVNNEAVSNVLYLIGFAAVPAIPVAIGIAILRYHLYDIDRLISRTVSWTVISAALVAVFAGGVLALQTVLAGVTQVETLAVAASTLLAAVLFQPLRGRVQRSVDRRFDRTAVDASRATAAFATRLRDEVDLETVTQDLVGTVDEVVRPVSSRVWLRRIGGSPTTS